MRHLKIVNPPKRAFVVCRLSFCLIVQFCHAHHANYLYSLHAFLL